MLGQGVANAVLLYQVLWELMCVLVPCGTGKRTKGQGTQALTQNALHSTLQDATTKTKKKHGSVEYFRFSCSMQPKNNVVNTLGACPSNGSGNRPLQVHHQEAS